MRYEVVWRLCWFTLVCSVSGTCDLDTWGLPLPSQDKSKVFSIPAIVALTWDDFKKPYFHGVHLSEAILYTIAHINRNVLNDTEFCVNTTIIDNYMLANKSVTLSMEYVGRLTEGTFDQNACSTETKAPVVGFVGAAMSDNTIALANLCNVLQIPQISYASTSLDLDDSEAYPYFLRTVPSDQLQAKAIVEIIVQSKSWSYVGIVAAEGNYGGAGLSAFLTEASNRSSADAFCIAFQYKLENPSMVVSNVVQSIRETEISVIVLFADLEGSTGYFNAIRKQYQARSPEDDELWKKVLNIIYIGSDSWSTQPAIFQDYYNNVFSRFIGVGVYKRDIAGFRDYLTKLNETNFNHIYNNLHTNYFLNFYNSGNRSNYLQSISNLDDHSSPSSDAMFAFGMGLREYIQLYNISSTYEANATQLYHLLRNIDVTSISGNQVSFGSENKQVGRYFIVHYVNRTFIPVGNYTSQHHLQYNNPYKNIPSICSAKCAGGQYKKSTSPCCHECLPCEEHTFSDGSQPQCENCGLTLTHNHNFTGCREVVPDVIRYTSFFAVVLYILIVLGIASVVGVVAIFYKQFNSPVVQGHGLFIYITLLSCCLILLASTLLFLGEPSDIICNLQAALPPHILTAIFLCIICLTKTVIMKLRSVKASNFYVIQLSILLMGLLVQAVVVTCVLYFKPLQYEKYEVKRGIVFGTCVGTNTMEIYLYLPTFIASISSLILSFMGRNINENYNEGKFLAFQSLAMHIVIAAFLPTKFVLAGPTLSGAWSVALLMICFIVLIVLFTPKIYIIIYRPYKNTFMDDFVSDTQAKNQILEEPSNDNLL